MCSYSNLSPKIMVGRRSKRLYHFTGTRLIPTEKSFHFHFAYRTGFNHPHTRIFVRLLGPCFKTGRSRPFQSVSKNLSARKYSPDALANVITLSQDRAGSKKAYNAAPVWGIPFSLSFPTPLADTDHLKEIRKN